MHVQLLLYLLFVKHGCVSQQSPEMIHCIPSTSWQQNNLSNTTQMTNYSLPTLNKNMLISYPVIPKAMVCSNTLEYHRVFNKI